MTLKYLLVLIALTGINVNCKSAYKLCVPAQHLKDCEAMLEVPTKSKAVLECIPARDRMECISYVQQRQADLVPVDPEDMYVASKIPNQDFVVFQEYRTDEEPDGYLRFYYEEGKREGGPPPPTSTDELSELLVPGYREISIIQKRTTRTH